MFKLLVLVASVCLWLCEAAFVDILQKCSTQDEDCLKKLLNNVLKEVSDNGIKEFDLQPIDPVDLKDMNISILNAFNISMVEGTVTGFKDCTVTRFDMRVDKGKATMNIVCDIAANGKYKMAGVSPKIQDIFGSDTIHGEGNFDLKLNKLHLTFYFHYNLEKNADDDIFVKFDNDKFRYKYNFEDANIKIDNIYLGDIDASELINTFVNQNWPFIMNIFGNKFFDISVNMVNDIIVSCFNDLPTKYYITEDLSPYVKT